jgi:hypoxanthine phosphoribosyltransferase
LWGGIFLNKLNYMTNQNAMDWMLKEGIDPLTIVRISNGELYLSEILEKIFGNVDILLIGLEHIKKWDEEEEERWDDPGDCAMDTLTQYHYSMSIR